MRTTLRNTSILIRRATALFLLLALLTGTVPAVTESAAQDDIDMFAAETLETLAEMALLKRKKTDDDLEGIRVRQNGMIAGRGISDEPSGTEPDYIGMVGYAVTENSGEFIRKRESIGLPWSVPAYLLFDKRWYYTRELQHKTGVLVIKQVLKETGKGRYTGRLKVIRLNSGEVCWMDVENFVTVPYWFYPTRRAVRYGSTVAAYRRKGDRLPTDEDGNPVRVKDGTDVLIPGYGVWDKRPPEGSEMIPGIIYRERIKKTVKDGEIKETRLVETTVLMFPEEDLTTTY